MNGRENSRDRVRKALSGGKPAVPPFMPWVCVHAARVEHLPLSRMLTDPALLSRAVQNAQKLYGYDVVINVFDQTIEAEACGCPIKWGEDGELPVLEDHPAIEEMTEEAILGVKERGRLPAVLEATRRLKVNLGRTVATAGVVTGPFTLAGLLSGHDVLNQLESDPERVRNHVELAGRVCLEVCKAYCEIGLDLVVLAESVLPRLPVGSLSLANSVIDPLVNVIRFYDAIPLLLAHGCEQESVGLLKQMNVDGLVVDAKIESEMRRESPGCVVGRSLPSALLKEPKEKLALHLNDVLRVDDRAPFVATEWQVPYDTPPESMREITDLIRQL